MPALPKAEARRSANERGDYLFLCNQFETLRMCYTLFNAIGSVPPGHYYFQVWDVFRNGVFLRTEYQVYRN